MTSGPWSLLCGMALVDAKKRAGIPGWEEHPMFENARDFSGLLAEKMPPVDTSYNV